MHNPITRLNETSDIVFDELQKCQSGEVSSEHLGRVAHAGIAIAINEKYAFDIERKKGLS